MIDPKKLDERVTELKLPLKIEGTTFNFMKLNPFFYIVPRKSHEEMLKMLRVHRP